MKNVLLTIAAVLLPPIFWSLLMTALTAFFKGETQIEVFLGAWAVMAFIFFILESIALNFSTEYKIIKKERENER